MEKIIVSAPGKIILAGEHSVVYGEPAIVAAVDKRIRVSLNWRDDGKVIIKDKHKDLSLVRYMVDECLKRLGKNRGVEIEIESEIPVNSGMGSSAALATGIVWAMMKGKDRVIKDKLVLMGENRQHGKASGVDPAIVREGGAIKYQKGEGFEKFEVTNLEFILIDSGRPVESTGELVEKVGKGNYKREIKRMGELVENWDVSKISENQKLLEKIEVVGEKAKRIVREIEKIGGMAKVCGAGGVKRGSGVILGVHDKIERLKLLACEEKWPWFQVKLGVEGVKYESS